MSSTLEYLRVSKTYPRSERAAVRGVDLAVAPGEILALVGESGSGKTTLLRLAAGLEVPDGGEIRIGDEVVAGPMRWVPPEKRAIGFVFQDGALFPHLTVAGNIAYGLRGKTEEQQSLVIDYILAMVGLSGMQARFPHELSGGERQRLAVARALAPQPKVMLLDEPFSSLDPALRRGLRDEVRRILKKLNATAIVVTHDADDALVLGDRLAVFREGEIEQIGPPGEVYRQPRNGYCARLFGPANEVRGGADGEKTRWLRPEDMVLCGPGDAEALAVRVEQVRDAGRHWEVFVQREGSQRVEDGWVVRVDSLGKVKAGTRCGVRIPREPGRGSGA